MASPPRKNTLRGKLVAVLEDLCESDQDVLKSVHHFLLKKTATNSQRNDHRKQSIEFAGCNQKAARSAAGPTTATTACLAEQVNEFLVESPLPPVGASLEKSYITDGKSSSSIHASAVSPEKFAVHHSLH